MSAFAKLLEQAKAKGVQLLTFHCHLLRDDENARWDATANRPDFAAPMKRSGRSGEEALRNLVEALP